MQVSCLSATLLTAPLLVPFQVVTHEEMMVTKDIDSFLSGEEASNAIGGLLHFPQRPSAHVR